MRAALVRWLASGVGALVPLWLAACSDLDVPDSRFPAQSPATHDGGAADRGAPVFGDGGFETTLTVPAGRWALFTEDNKCLNALGSATHSVIWSWYLVDIEDAGSAGEPGARLLRHRLRLCEQTLSPLVGGLRTLIPAEIPASLPAHRLHGFLLGEAKGAQYVLDELVDVWGAEGVGPGDALPMSADDPRVFDQDGDGEPAVTFVVASSRGEPLCQVHVVQRTTTRLSGRVEHGALVTGEMWSRIDKVVLDATSPLCASDNELVNSTAASRFALIRIDGRAGALNLDLDGDQRTDCAELIASGAALHDSVGFTPITPDNSVCR